MTTRRLHLSKDLSLPLDFVTKTAAILAQRRKGKTYTASVIAEEMVAAKQPFVALDPTGAWWGLRASADGQQEGLPVVVLGGQHGDVPLERTAGRLIADLVIDQPGFYVIDFSLFESGEAERQFAVDFAERLYRAKGQPGKDFPLHLFVDEADRFIPQQMRKGSNETSPRLLGAFEAIVRRGGLRGLGTTLISQRAAIVNKNVLEMIDVLIALRTVGPNDREAIAGYIDAHGTDAERKEMMGSLASLDIGEAWVWEPGAEPPLFERVRIRPRQTFNSSATPKPGQQRIEPKRLAQVDLAALEQKMAATIEKAKADDPRELRKQIAELKAENVKLAKARASEMQVVMRTKLTLTDAERALLEKFANRLSDMASLLEKGRGQALARATDGISQAVAILIEDQGNRTNAYRKSFEQMLEQKGFQKILDKLATVSPSIPIQPPSDHRNVSAAPRSPQPRRVDRALPPSTRRTPARLVSDGDVSLGKGERIILTAVAQYPDGATREQLTVLTGYARSSRDTYLQRLSQAGFIHQNGGGTLRATDIGITALGDFEPLPIGDDLRAYWMRELPEGERRVLEVLVKAYPHAVERSSIDEATGYARSSRDTYLQRLGARKLVVSTRDGVIASQELFS